MKYLEIICLTVSMIIFTVTAVAIIGRLEGWFWFIGWRIKWLGDTPCLNCVFFDECKISKEEAIINSIGGLSNRLNLFLTYGISDDYFGITHKQMKKRLDELKYLLMCVRERKQYWREFWS